MVESGSLQLLLLFLVCDITETCFPRTCEWQAVEWDGEHGGALKVDVKGNLKQAPKNPTTTSSGLACLNAWRFSFLRKMQLLPLPRAQKQGLEKTLPLPEPLGKHFPSVKTMLGLDRPAGAW